MMRKKPATHAEREQQILDAAADVFIQYGYDKTTMSDIAERAEVTRAIVYLHFDSKESLFESLLYRETHKYLQCWLEALDATTSGGTIARIFGSVLVAVQRSPFLSALMKQDRQVFGKYLRKPGSFLESVQNRSVWPELLKELQNVGAIRQDLKPEVMGHIMNALAVGVIALEEGKTAGETPAFNDLIETMADMIDRALMPEDGGNAEAGKAIIRQLALATRSQLEQDNHPSGENHKS